MDVTALIGTELKSVCFVEDYLELCFNDSKVTLFAWPHVLLTEFSVAYGEPEYRNALCAQIGEEVVEASLEEGSALTIELANAVVLGLSLREEEIDAPVSGNYSESGDPGDAEEF
jgi:hypothetical protein